MLKQCNVDETWSETDVFVGGRLAFSDDCSIGNLTLHPPCVLYSGTTADGSCSDVHFCLECPSCEERAEWRLPEAGRHARGSRGDVPSGVRRRLANGEKKGEVTRDVGFSDDEDTQRVFRSPLQFAHRV